MDMNKTFFKKKEAHTPKWHLIDAEGKILGRLATEIADVLRGKNKPDFTSHTDCGDYVVVVNAEKIALTGNKWKDKIYVSYSGYIGGKKEISAQSMKEKHPERIVEHAVKGMLPKNKLSRQIIKKLKVYAGTDHPHIAQQPQTA